MDALSLTSSVKFQKRRMPGPLGKLEKDAKHEPQKTTSDHCTAFRSIMLNDGLGYLFLLHGLDIGYADIESPKLYFLMGLISASGYLAFFDFVLVKTTQFRNMLERNL